MGSGPQAEPDLRTILEAAGFGQWLDTGRLVVLPAGTSQNDVISVPRAELAVALNYLHHLASVMAQTTGLDNELRTALAVLDEEFKK